MSKYDKTTALISLLEDTDEKISTVAFNELVLLGEKAIPNLKENYFDSTNSDYKSKINDLLKVINQPILEEKFKFILHNNTFDCLESGVFLISNLEFPTLNSINYLEKLDDFANEILEDIVHFDDHFEVLGAMNRFFFEKMNFRGNQTNYYEPENSFINCVIDGKKGIPISLSVIFILVARRLNFPISGVGVPGHFLLKFRGKRDIFIDPFNNGNFLTAEDCKKFVKLLNIPFKDEFLYPVSDKYILQRMLRNLVGVYQNLDQKEKMEAFLRFSMILQKSPVG
ncbi:MAG: hypothetical protein DWQ06_12685 [Calditrichaeota bacterium]|nr:MAG: hypothetical protein DWQ06_12685 [Calditrichota bacterium]